MVKTAKNSIKAIIFVSIYIFFIFFISLFKGINLYNIKIPYFKASHIFIKIDKKLIFKAKNIEIISSKNYQKTALNIHKEFYLISKILPFFQEIKLENIKYNNKLIFKKIKLSHNNIYIYSKDLYLNGRFKLKYNVTYISLDVLKYKKYKFKNIFVIIYYTPKNIYANINMLYQKKPFYIALKISDFYIYNSVLFPKLAFNYNNFRLNLNDCNINGKINTTNYNFNEKIVCKHINIKNKFFIDSFYNKITLNKKDIYLSAKKASLGYKKLDINNSLLLNYNFYFSFPLKDLMLNARKIQINYKKYKIFSNNLALNYNVNNKNLFLHTTNLHTKNNINFSSKEIVIYKTGKTLYYLNKNSLQNKYINLFAKKIKGNLSKILITDIIGKIFKFDTFIKSPVINLKTKSAKSPKIIVNNIVFDNNILKFNKNYTFKTHTKTLFDKNVDGILNYFKITIPLIQTKGKNEINLSISSNLKKFNLNYYVKSQNSVFKIKNFKIPFNYKRLIIKGNLNKSYISLNNFNFPYRFLNTVFDTNTTVNIPGKYLNSFVYIKKLNIDKYIEIKNFNEKIALDLVKNYLFILNSAIFINLQNKTIYFYDLKRLLKYSIFNEIFQNGEAIVKLLKNKVAIFVNADTKYPVILNQKDPKKIKANILITKNNIDINTNNGKVEIKNLEKLNAFVKNKDIDIIGLVNIIKCVDKLVNEINESDTNANFKVAVNGIDTNFTYKVHKFITKKAMFEYNKEFKFSAKYGKSSLSGHTKNGYLLIEGKHYNTKTLIPLLDFFTHFSKIDLDFILIKSPENFYTGKIFINSAIVKDLKLLNNIIAFVNTVPALLTLHSPGYSSKGYKIKKGFISYILYNNVLYFKQIKINGINLDFNGKGYIDLNKDLIKLKLNVIVKLKLKKIPLVGKALSYLFFGKDGYLHINIIVSGVTDNPKIKQDFGFGIESPFILFKRALTLPFNIF